MCRAAKTSERNASFAKSLHTRPLPTEIFHEIVSHTIASFFDELVAGALEYDWRKDTKLRRLTGLELRNALALEAAVRVEAEEENDLPRPNPVDALLCTSYQLRHLALQVLSKILDVSYIPGGVGRIKGVLPAAVAYFRAFRRLLWVEKINTCVRPEEAEPVEYTSDIPALATCFSVASIQRETITMREFARGVAKAREVYEPALLPWLQDSPARWTEAALADLERCPEAFRDVLAPRVADAVVGARIEEIFSLYYWDLQRTWNIIEPFHRILINERTQGDLLAAVPEGLLRYTLRDLLKRVTNLLRFIDGQYHALLELPKTLPLSRSLDEMIRPQHFRRYLCLLFDINWYGRIEGEEYKECKQLTTTLRASIKQQFDKVWSGASDDPEEGDAEAGTVEQAQVEDEQPEGVNAP